MYTPRSPRALTAVRGCMGRPHSGAIHILYLSIADFLGD